LLGVSVILATLTPLAFLLVERSPHFH
jgi:hypothetical protein